MKLDGHSLTLETVLEVAHSTQSKLSFSTDAIEKMKTSREFVLSKLSEGKAIYGINTGFGALSSQKIEDSQLEELQYNLIRSHCTGVGELFDCEETRAIMLLRANCLCQGHSGVNLEVGEQILRFLNKNLIPAIPSQGSVGASGDLAPLSHLALTLIGEGKVFQDGELVPTKNALEKLGLKPAPLGPKDGLALINGTTVMAALGTLYWCEAHELFKTADIAAALTNEAVRGTNNAYNPLISHVKRHAGQNLVVQNLNKLLCDSEIRKSHLECGKVQDPYSLRCVPQVHGACRQTLDHAHEILKNEINAVTDNPLIFPEEGEILSGGNFHGESLALCLDYLAMGVAELGNISERRIEKMMNPQFSDLPPFLTKKSGLNSGLMIAHVTVAALASENKIYCHPASVDSIPTSTDKEDHVSMGVTSASKLKKVVTNVRNILAIELLCNTQALEFLKPLKPSPPLQDLYQHIRKSVAPIEKDRPFSDDIRILSQMIKDKEITQTINKSLGPQGEIL